MDRTAGSEELGDLTVGIATDGAADTGGPVSAFTREQLAAWASMDERILRLQSPPDGHLGDVAERSLARLDPMTPLGALRRWAYIKHLYLARSEGLGEAAKVGGGSKEDAARALLRREPFYVQLGPHRVGITARSYNAMAEIAQHAVTIRQLQLDAERAEELEQALLIIIEQGNRNTRGRARRRYRNISRVHLRILAEIGLHRRAIYAHALTRSGAPAQSLTEAPAWVEEVDQVWDTALILGVQEAGAGRFFRMGDPPARKNPRQPAESFGWASHFAQIERDMKVQAATYFDHDLYQQLVWARLADPVMEEGGDG